eukprot:g3672.t1
MAAIADAAADAINDADETTELKVDEAEEDEKEVETVREEENEKGGQGGGKRRRWRRRKRGKGKKRWGNGSGRSKRRMSEAERKEFLQKVETFLIAFKAGEMHDESASLGKKVGGLFKFAKSFSGAHRKIIHAAATDLGLFHWSIGENEDRQICVTSSEAEAVEAQMDMVAEATRIPKPRLTLCDYTTVSAHPHEEDVRALILANASASSPLPSEESCNVPLVKDRPAAFVDTLAQLDELHGILNSADEIYIDLEMHNFRSYYGFTCLLQISTIDSCFIVDTIALWDHVKLLRDVFANPRIRKVFHACGSGDIPALHRDFGIFCVNVFDTQVAAEALGRPMGLAHLLRSYFKSDIDTEEIVSKKERYQVCDWRERPLTSGHLKYAQRDTLFLRALKARLTSDLLREDKDGELYRDVFEKSQQLVRRLWHPPKRHFRKSKCSSMAANLGVEDVDLFTRMLLWREEAAQRLDESPAFICSDLVLGRLAQVKPRNSAELLKAWAPSPASFAIYPDLVEEVLSKILH